MNAEALEICLVHAKTDRYREKPTKLAQYFHAQISHENKRMLFPLIAFGHPQLTPSGHDIGQFYFRPILLAHQ